MTTDLPPIAFSNPPPRRAKLDACQRQAPFGALLGPDASRSGIHVTSTQLTMSVANVMKAVLVEEAGRGGSKTGGTARMPNGRVTR